MGMRINNTVAISAFLLLQVGCKKSISEEVEEEEIVKVKAEQPQNEDVTNSPESNSIDPNIISLRRK